MRTIIFWLIKSVLHNNNLVELSFLSDDLNSGVPCERVEHIGKCIHK